MHEHEDLTEPTDVNEPSPPPQNDGFFSKPEQASVETFDQPKTVPINNPPQALQQQSPQTPEPPSLFPDAAADLDPDPDLEA